MSKNVMYTAYFDLNDYPFSLTPDPRFLFLSQRHREALAHLIYGVGERGGFVLLTGEVGTGKTTLCRSLLEQAPDGVEAALILNPKQTALELVASLCDELRIAYPHGTDSLKILIDRLNHHLLDNHAEGRRTVLIIDEAQNLSVDVLEQVRLLTNLETTTTKLLQILLIGQPELQKKMEQPELRQLAQRITARYHLSPLLPEETIAYVQHRLEVAGCKRPLFTRAALRRVHALSNGIPRVINTICDRALLGAYAKKMDRVNRGMVTKAASEVRGPNAIARPGRSLVWTSALAASALLWAGWQYWLYAIPEQRSHLPGKGPNPLVQFPSGVIPGASGPWASRESVPLRSSEASAQPQRTPEWNKAQVGEIKKDVAESPALNVLREWFLAERPPTDMDAAFAALFREWRSDYLLIPGMGPCERAAKAGLRCYKDRGNWTTLRHLNMPVILELVDPRPRRHYVAAVRLGDKTITLLVEGQDITMDLHDVEPFWFGDFTLLWMPPRLTSPVVKEGDRGPDVLWLRNQLDRAEGIDITGSGAGGQAFVSPSFDEELKRRVMAFQRSHFVKADGIVGEQTLIHLTRAAAGAHIPLLCAEATDGEKHVANP